MIEPHFAGAAQGYPMPLLARRRYVPMNLIKSKQRVAEHGEVFTPPKLVDAMLDLVKDETERIDARFLEPACGVGNFLMAVLKRKLAAVDLKYGQSDFDRRYYALLALMCCYGIELLDDNVAECRRNLLKLYAEYLGVTEADDDYQAAAYVIGLNIVQGDALSLRSHGGEPIVFAEWGPLSKGKYQRRDFRYDDLTERSTAGDDGGLFPLTGRHRTFTPIKTWPKMTARQLAHERTKAMNKSAA